MKPCEARALLFASIGGALEFYDFVVFVFSAFSQPAISLGP